MKYPFSAIDTAKQELDKLEIDDPIVKLEANSMVLVPRYFSSSFVSIYFFLLLPFILLFAQPDPKYHLAAGGLILVWIYILLSRLRYCNTVRFDVGPRCISVIPSILFRGIKKKKIISFDDIDHIDFKDNGASPGAKRYLIFVSTNEKTIPLISTKSEINSIALLKIFRLLTK